MTIRSNHIMKVFLWLFLFIEYLQEITAHSSKYSTSSFRSNPAVCETEACIHAAEEIMANMDTSIWPCDDFYEFACGGFKRRHTIPDDQLVITMFSYVTNIVHYQLRDLLERPLTGSEPKYVKVLKDTYASCMDTEGLESTAFFHLNQILESLGGWPVVKGDHWDDSAFDWLETLIAMRDQGFNHNIFMVLAVTVDVKDNRVHILTLDQHNVNMAEASFNDKEFGHPIAAAYFDMLVHSDPYQEIDTADYEEQMREVSFFEKELISNLVPDSERKNMTRMYNKYSVMELQEFIPQVNWLRYFNGLLGILVTPFDQVLILEPDYIKKTAELITSTSKRILANYMLSNVVEQSVPMLSNKLKSKHRQRGMSPIDVDSRAKMCLKDLNDYLGMALGAYYIKNYFEEETKEKVMVILNHIRAEFIHILENITWMDNTTKINAIEKAKAIVPYIGYPRELADDTIVSKEYENIHINSECYLKNILAIRKFNTDKMFWKLREPTNIPDWREHAQAATPNAFYSPADNTIEIPAAILQRHIFNLYRPNYLNFAGIGSTIGHEMTHGFDNEGRKFNKDGNYQNWWDQQTDERFKEKMNCILEQYGNYTSESGFKLNPQKSIGDDIADNAGTKQAYWAYQSWVENNGLEPSLPSLAFTPNQLFWISSANLWCSKYRYETERLAVLLGDHSLSRFRVIGPLSNSEEFSRDFNCPIGSNMNPLKKCNVW